MDTLNIWKQFSMPTLKSLLREGELEVELADTVIVFPIQTLSWIFTFSEISLKQKKIIIKKIIMIK